MIGSTINVGAMSVSRSVHTVSAILAVNSNRDIYFPRSPGAVISTREGFYNLGGFPKVLGAIDGSLVPIIAPSENEPVYVSRKGYHAINVQGIMNAELLFTNIVARWPGSTHDSFILLNSAVYTNFETGQYPDAVASRRTRGPIDNISFGAPVWPVPNHRVVFRILRVFRIV